MSRSTFQVESAVLEMIAMARRGPGGERGVIDQNRTPKRFGYVEAKLSWVKVVLALL